MYLVLIFKLQVIRKNTMVQLLVPLYYDKKYSSNMRHFVMHTFKIVLSVFSIVETY